MQGRPLRRCGRYKWNVPSNGESHRMKYLEAALFCGGIAGKRAAI